MKIHTGNPSTVPNGIPCNEERINMDKVLRISMRSGRATGCLCGPQIGYLARVISLKCKKPPRFISARTLVLWSPRITWRSATEVVGEESNYSIVDDKGKAKTGKVSRSTSVEVEWMETDGCLNIGKFHGMEARMLQHMVDFLNGVAFTEKVVPGE